MKIGKKEIITSIIYVVIYFLVVYGKINVIAGCILIIINGYKDHIIKLFMKSKE